MPCFSRGFLMACTYCQEDHKYTIVVKMGRTFQKKAVFGPLWPVPPTGRTLDIKTQYRTRVEH